MTEFWDTLIQLTENLGTLLVIVAASALRWALLIAWVAWWLFAVDWRKAWSVLGRGAWVPAVLLLVVAALVWSQIEPAKVGNFWVQLGCVSALAALALLCGWLQGVFGIVPAEVSVEPVVIPGPDHEHAVGALHGHDFAHSDDPHPDQAH
jgi:hypothetical protein